MTLPMDRRGDSYTAQRAAADSERCAARLCCPAKSGHGAGKQRLNSLSSMQQGVVVARALVMKPALMMAGEPTGRLDRAASDKVFALMQQHARRAGLLVPGGHARSQTGRTLRLHHRSGRWPVECGERRVV